MHIFINLFDARHSVLDNFKMIDPLDHGVISNIYSFESFQILKLPESLAEVTQYIHVDPEFLEGLRLGFESRDLTDFVVGHV